MSISAQSIIRRATDLLQDQTSVRWPANELVRWLNDAQRAIVKVRPDAMNTTTTFRCSQGSRQSLASATANAGISALSPAPSKLIEITRNVAASSAKKAVRLVPREILDAQTPGWHSISPSVDILHYMFDPRDPRTFYTYPPATTAAELEVMYSAYPTDIVEPADGALYTDVTGNAADLLSSGFVTGGINVTVNDALTIAQMAALDAANGLGTITLLSGFADSYANLAANVGGYVAVDNVEVTDGAITVAQAHVLQALTSGAVIADVSTTAIADLVSLNDTNGADAGGVEAGNLFSVQMSMADIEAYAASNVMINLALDTVIKVVNSIAANTQAITITGDEYSREMDFSVLTGNAGNGITLNGGARHDIITGSGNDDVINGDAGNDTITGGAGDDVITGGAGADVITGGDGADDITGGAGVDLIDLSELVDITDTVVAGLVADGIDEISNIDLFSGPGTIDFVDFTNTTVATDAAQGDFAAPIALSTADTVESFEISNGLVTLFDEATGVGTTELFAVNGADIAAIIAALSGVVTNEALAFKVDADDNGVADGTVVLSENGAGVEAVYLTDVVVVGVADFPIGPGNAFIA